MARADLRNQANADGDWFVDRRCIDCGTCRDIAPDLFVAEGDLSVVARQPAPAELTDAWLAAQACPTSSIGTLSHQPRPGRLYPREIEPGSGVYDLGYCSEDSFGASAWLAVRPEGNILVDAPRFTQALVTPIEAMGGLAHVVLTHRDDVADADRYADHFGARVWIHEDDRSAAPYATDLIRGSEEVVIAPGFSAIPVPGHTKGSVVFLADGRYLFSGDSLAWSHQRHDLVAFSGACWYSWSAQTESLRRLAEDHRFAWVLPGHGARVSGNPDDLHERLDRLLDRMRTTKSRRP
jgi:glyoxylase-like metal-dependent hydrolase (beta-lactamase superfamily II)/ferredoxin